MLIIARTDQLVTYEPVEFENQPIKVRVIIVEGANE